MAELEQTDWEKLEQEIKKAEFVLVGIGKEFHSTERNQEYLMGAYNHLSDLLKEKTYFVVTENEDNVIFSSKIMDFFIAAPFADEERIQSSEEQWNAYLNWLTATLNHRLCILELGVGFQNPQVIRWPFEKTAQFNLKSVLIRINGSFPQLAKEIVGRGISIHENAVDFLNKTHHSLS